MKSFFMMFPLGLNFFLGNLKLLKKKSELYDREISLFLATTSSLILLSVYFLYAYKEESIYVRSIYFLFGVSFLYMAITFIVLCFGVYSKELSIIDYKLVSVGERFSLKAYKREVINSFIEERKLKGEIKSQVKKSSKALDSQKNFNVIFEKLILLLNKFDNYDSEKKRFILTGNYSVSPLQSFQILLIFFQNNFELNQDIDREVYFKKFNSYFDIEGKTMTSNNWAKDLENYLGPNMFFEKKRHMDKSRFYKDLQKIDEKNY